MATTLPHTVVFTVLRDEDRTAAYEALDRFGGAVSVEETDERHIVAVCPEQRGERGAYRLHAIACAYGALVHVR